MKGCSVTFPTPFLRIRSDFFFIEEFLHNIRNDITMVLGRIIVFIGLVQLKAARTSNSVRLHGRLSIDSFVRPIVQSWIVTSSQLCIDRIYTDLRIEGLD